MKESILLENKENMLSYQQKTIAILVALFTFAHGQLTEQAINQRLSSEVVAPFQAGLTQYNALLSQLWNLLQGYDPESEISVEIPESVKVHSDSFLANLRTSSNNCKKLQSDTFTLVAQQTEQVSAIERNIEHQNSLIANANVQMQTSQNAVNLASTGLNNANSEVASHRDALQSAESRYNKAKNDCFGKRRRKRGFLKKVFKGVKNVVKKTVELPQKVVKETYRGICRGLGALTGKIDHEKRKVREAEGRVAQAQANLNAKQSELNNAKNALATEQQKLVSLQQQKADSQASLVAAQQKKESLVATNAKMMKTVGFLDGMKTQGEAVSLTMELGYILDVDNVLSPLKEISVDLQRLGVGGAGGFIPSISPENILYLNCIIKRLSSTGVRLMNVSICLSDLAATTNKSVKNNAGIFMPDT